MSLGSLVLHWGPLVVLWDCLVLGGRGVLGTGMMNTPVKPGHVVSGFAHTAARAQEPACKENGTLDSRAGRETLRTLGITFHYLLAACEASTRGGGVLQTPTCCYAARSCAGEQKR